MEFLEYFDLSNYNSFKIAAKARYFGTINNMADLTSFFSDGSKIEHKVLLLGGGNNILFTRDFEGFVLKINIKGITVLEENNKGVTLEVAAGEDWDDFVAYCVSKGWAGIENLSLIPGQVGSSPIQNIGAYGVEVKDVITEVRAFNRQTLGVENFPNEACAFGYRSSVFKTKYRDSHIITSVVFRLQKADTVNISYKALSNELIQSGITSPSINDVREAVCRVRNSKLPDTKELGNAGSFFKNPVIDINLYKSLLLSYPDLISYPSGDATFKIAAGWLIEKAGWKGYRKGDAGVHDKQALILINAGKATGTDLIDLANEIRGSISDKFGIELDFEVNII